MSRLPLVLGLLILAAASLTAQDSRPALDEARVRALVRELDARDFEARERAFAEIEKIGVAARSLILELKEGASPEARLRLEALLERLGGSEETVSVELATRRLDLVLERTRVVDALELFARKTGFEFAAAQDLDLERTVDLELRRVTAFEALDALASRLERGWMQDYGSGQIRFFRTAGTTAPHVIYEGPFRFSLESISINTSLVFGGEVRSNCYIQGKIELEPGNQVLGLFIQPWLRVARDDLGRNLVPEQAAGIGFQTAGQRRSFNFNMRFEQPAPEATRIERLEASLQVVVPKLFDEYEIVLAAGKSSADGRLRFRSEIAVGDRRRIELAIERVVPKTPGERPVDLPVEIIEFVTENGEVLRPLGQVQRFPSGTEELLRFDLAAGGGALRTLSLRNLVEIETRALDFVFEGIPLP